MEKSQDNNENRRAGRQARMAGRRRDLDRPGAASLVPSATGVAPADSGYQPSIDERPVLERGKNDNDNDDESSGEYLVSDDLRPGAFHSGVITNSVAHDSLVEPEESKDGEEIVLPDAELAVDREEEIRRLTEALEQQ